MPAKPKFLICCRLLLAGALLGITVLSLIPSPPEPPVLFSWDKLQHAAAYAVLTLLFYGANLHRSRCVPYAFFCATFAWCYGVLIEVLQLLMPFGRVAEFSDLVANLTGALFALLLLLFYRLTNRPVCHEA